MDSDNPRDEYAIVADMVREAERHADDGIKGRTRAVEYYNGVMKDTPTEATRSKMVTRDIRAHIKKVLPSIMRTIFGGSEIVRFDPVGPEDEEPAQQASDFMNSIVIPEAGVETALYDAVFDALRVKNGIIKWWWDERDCVKVSRHSGLDETALGVLAGDDDTTILEHSERVEETEQGPIASHDVKIRRVVTERQAKCAAVPRDRFLIHPDAVTLADSLLTGEKMEMRRSDLIAMGYDREMIMGLPIAGEDYDERDRDELTGTSEAQRANDLVDYYDVYIRIDMDGDGIAELRHMCLAGGLAQKNVVMDEECDEVQFCDIYAMRMPHQWEATALVDDLMDIQQAKTVLLRQTMDNLYWQNNLQPIVEEDSIADMESVLNPEFGKPIVIRSGRGAKDTVNFAPVPFVAKESFSMLEYLDTEAQDRTGVSDASAGLAPDALQNMTAKASAMIEQSGIGQTEMMVRNIAHSAEPLFRGLLRLIVRHQDKARTVRLRGEWVEFDPRHWNADMDVTVSTGLGAGTRERDMMAVQAVMGFQEKLLGAFGPDNPFVKPKNIYNALAEFVRAAGMKDPEMFFTKPDEEEIKAKMEAASQKPDPEMAKVEAQMKMESVKSEAAIAKERAQMEADLMTERARIESDRENQKSELAAKMALQDKQLAWEREKFAMEMQVRKEEAATSRQDEIWKAQASAFAAE